MAWRLTPSRNEGTFINMLMISTISSYSAWLRCIANLSRFRFGFGTFSTNFEGGAKDNSERFCFTQASSDEEAMTTSYEQLREATTL
jgi:hypothetical protein